MRRKIRFSFIALGLIVLVGLAVRIDGLTDFTIGHIELYTPGIDLPDALSIPAPRLDLLSTLKGCILWEPHPPAYYVIMLGWTELFGTSALSLRLPSVLFGVASILLVYFIAAIERERITGLLAAGMLALNGLSIFWSQTSKMYGMGCFLGLLSTSLLLRVIRQPRRRLLYLVFYCGTTLAGLATVVFFWPILLTHMLWVILTQWNRLAFMPGLLRTQLFVFCMASPLLAVIIYSAQRPPYIDESILLPSLFHFFQFGYLFEPDPNAVVPDGVHVAIHGILLLSAVIAFFRGIVSLRKAGAEVEEGVDTIAGQHFVVTLSAGMLSFVSIVVFGLLIKGKAYGQTNGVFYVGLVPFVLAGADYLLCRHWPAIHGFLSSRAPRLGQQSCLRSLSLLLLIIPVTMLTLVSIVSPVFLSRTTLLYTPYLIIILSIGLSSLICRHRGWLVLAGILLALHVFSVRHFRDRLHHPVDYKTLARKLESQTKDSDLVFIRKHWITSPVFYYLNPRNYNYVHKDYQLAVMDNPDARVWVLHVEDIFPQQGIGDALSQFKHSGTVCALRTKADLYERSH